MMPGARLAAAGAMLLAAACSAIEPGGAGLVTSSITASSHDMTVAAAGDEAPDVSSATRPKEAFNPFRDPAATASGGREVIANPSLAEILKAGPLAEMVVGRADAPVTVIKYMSLTCPYCRRFQLTAYPEIKRRYIDTGKVRFIFREFPIGLQSGAATIALRCAPPSRYVELYEKFMAQQGSWVSQEVRLDPIARVAAQVGVTRAQYDACRQDARLVEGLKAIKERGRTLGIVGTPNFFVENRLVKSVLDAQQMSDLIEQALAAKPRSTAGAAEDRGPPL